MTEYVKVRDLQRGMMVDLAADPYATCGDPDCDGHTWEFEYGVVDELERETSDCIRVDFDNGDSIGFPPDHVVTVEGSIEEEEMCLTDSVDRGTLKL